MRTYTLPQQARQIKDSFLCTSAIPVQRNVKPTSSHSKRSIPVERAKTSLGIIHVLISKMLLTQNRQRPALSMTVSTPNTSLRHPQTQAHHHPTHPTCQHYTQTDLEHYPSGCTRTPDTHPSRHCPPGYCTAQDRSRRTWYSARPAG